MPSLASITIAALASAVVLASASVDFTKDYTGEPICMDNNRMLCLNGWGVGMGNITFHMQCRPTPGQGNGNLSWCALGLNSGGNLTSWGMYPAEVFLINVLANGNVVVEDRQNVATAAPECFPTPLSYVLYSGVDANGVVSASWTRPVVPSPALQAEGYLAINNTVTPLIGAWASGEAPVSDLCDTANLSFHDQVFNNYSINFLAF